MPSKFFITLLLSFLAFTSRAQLVKVHGKITDNKLEPLAFVTLQVKELGYGAVSKENGEYELMLEEGKYDLVISMIGFKPQLLTIIAKGKEIVQNVIMEEEEANLSEVVVKTKLKDKAEEIVRNVIRNKEHIVSAAGAYSCQVYIKASQEKSLSAKKNDKQTTNPSDKKNVEELNKMAMAEIIMRLDHESSRRMKEQRIGITKRGKAESLFYLSATEGDFSLYNNLINIPSLSKTPFLSPVSYSGLIAYKYKTTKIEKLGDKKIYTISIKPRQLSNATIEGEIVVADSSFVILHSRFRLPSYHLPEYDFFEVEQNYEWVNNLAWMITRQQFTYYSKTNKMKQSGQTVAVYNEFELQKHFEKKYFGVEASSTAQEAYEKDSSFWQQSRAEPLTEKEIRFIRYNDSIFHLTHTKAYLDSLDKKINKITWKKLMITGQTFHNHEKERSFYLPTIPNIYQPFQFGGGRIGITVAYTKKFKSKKDVSIFSSASYGLRNRDFNGSFRLYRLYNPFNRGYYGILLRREFDHFFEGDAWINMLKRSNVYLNNTIGAEHSLEIVNGLYLFAGVDLAFRRSVSDYKTNSKIDTLLGEILTNNQPVHFEPYNAFYGRMRLQYTPFQRYLREPKEKVILGSSWPTFFATMRKGIPDIFRSKVDFDYLEFGMEQQIKIGLVGISNYRIKTGSFINTKDLRMVDYQFQRQGDPLLFMNPHEAFQALDSTFPVFKRFYQAHYVHEFNGALLNKIPLLKKLQLREIIGSGFLVAPEKNLRYVEAFAGIERIFKWPFDPLSKFKLGIYVAGSAANKYNNPIQFKIGLTTWDKQRNKWY
ncbi:MAG TPA: DUF5686 and carboxypeptidase regulatory-like domain-containing protein [Chitinophagaceae bacterium]|jgi:hypothetical protein|nr:DUF5686 and carboxypeptidase regulatory-like domain-containing protein [Chitinophagaceae bacterium]